MQVEQLLHIIQQPQNIEVGTLNELRKTLHQYPYFQLACSLIAKALYDQDATKAQQAIQLAAVYATDRNRLKQLLENKLSTPSPFKTLLPSQSSLQRTDSTITTTPTPSIPQTDFINSYISNISAKATQRITNQRSLEQLDIIENFIKKDCKFTRLTIKDLSLEDSHIDLTKESIILHDNLLTENLAQVMLKQGKFDRAIDIYKRLQLKFPDKQSYFSTRTEDSKKEGAGSPLGNMGAHQIIGVKKTGDLLEQVTWGLLTGLFVFSLTTSFLIKRSNANHAMMSPNLEKAQQESSLIAPTQQEVTADSAVQEKPVLKHGTGSYAQPIDQANKPQDILA
eukprot:gene3011-3761_t